MLVIFMMIFKFFADGFRFDKEVYNRETLGIICAELFIEVSPFVLLAIMHNL